MDVATAANLNKEKYIPLTSRLADVKRQIREAFKQSEALGVEDKDSVLNMLDGLKETEGALHDYIDAETVTPRPAIRCIVTERKEGGKTCQNILQHQGKVAGNSSIVLCKTHCGIHFARAKHIVVLFFLAAPSLKRDTGAR